MNRLRLWIGKNKTGMLFVCLVVLILLSIVIILPIGYLAIDSREIVKIIWSTVCADCVTYEPLARNIILDIRLPRIIAAIPVGAGLALSGVILQTITRNNLADPYLFGISGAGAFGGTLSLVLMQHSLGSLQFYLWVFMAVILSLLMLLQLIYYLRSPSMTYLILGGVALGYIWQGLQAYVLMYSPHAAMYVWSWQNGGLAVATWPQILSGLVIIAAIGAFFYLQSAALDALAFGTESAIILGVNVHYYRLMVLFICGIVVGLVVTIVGLIGFVGLVVPHILRYLLGSSAHRLLIPGSMLLGALLLIWFDVLAVALGGIYEVSVNTVSSFFGATFFLALLINIYKGQQVK